MEKFCPDGKNWFSLLTRIICDTEPATGGPVDVAYMFGQTAQNQGSALKALASLWFGKKVKQIAISSMGAIKDCHPGYPSWKKELMAAGVPESEFCAVDPAPDLPPCTDSEARGLVALAKESGWKSIFVVSPPLHIVRAFISTVSAVRKAGADMLVYSKPGAADNWQETVVHSQCVAKGPRKDLLSGELERILRYHDQGNLMSAEEVLAYLDWRDAQK